MVYIRCESCKRILNLSDGEWECPFCGNDTMGSDEVAERIYREYWKGVVGQPFKYQDLKVSSQTTFIAEKEGME